MIFSLLIAAAISPQVVLTPRFLAKCENGKGNQYKAFGFELQQKKGEKSVVIASFDDEIFPFNKNILFENIVFEKMNKSKSNENIIFSYGENVSKKNIYSYTIFASSKNSIISQFELQMQIGEGKSVMAQTYQCHIVAPANSSVN